MKLLMGIDGGATKTLVRVTDFDGTTVTERRGAASNFCTIGREQAAENLGGLLRGVMAELPDGAELCAVGIGAAGLLTDGDAAFYRSVITDATGCNVIAAENDAVTALYASFPEGAGISLTAGTGSICLGKNGDGTLARAGGWGHLFSDEGSAYAIAADAVRCCIAAWEGHGEPTVLTELLERKTGCRGIDGVVAALCLDHEKSGLASFARQVSEAADAGDSVAAGVLYRAGEQLSMLAARVAEKLGFGAHPFSVAVTGSVLLNSRTVRERFTACLAARYPAVTVFPAKADACTGALAMAMGLSTVLRN